MTDRNRILVHPDRPFPAVSLTVTAGIALAIGAGVVDWSYWWLLATGVPAGLTMVIWILAIHSWVREWFEVD